MITPCETNASFENCSTRSVEGFDVAGAELEVSMGERAFFST